MKTAVLGTGMVGRALAARLHELGHDVVVGTRDATATLSRPDTTVYGDAPFSVWAAEHPEITVDGYAGAVAGAELVVNATSGAASLAALTAAGEDALADVILLDIANPLDASQGMPPTLFVKDTDSLAEQIQAAFPRTRVVKALNTLNAYLMVEPRRLADGDHTVFVSGDDTEAKRVVTDLLESFGHSDVIDLGDITTARGTEMLLPLWLRLYGTLGTPEFNIKVVR